MLDRVKNKKNFEKLVSLFRYIEFFNQRICVKTFFQFDFLITPDFKTVRNSNEFKSIRVKINRYKFDRKYQLSSPLQYVTNLFNKNY